MDFNSLVGYLTSLAMLYAWTLFAAGMFALGERFCRNFFATKAAGGKPRQGSGQRLTELSARGALRRIAAAVFSFQDNLALCGRLREAT